MKHISRVYGIILLSAAFLITGCSSGVSANIAKVSESERKLSDFSAWVVYWDLDGAAQTIASLKDGLNGISMFAAYFDEQESLFIPDNILKFAKQTKEAHKSRQWEYYLSFVNDLKLDKGSSLKDTELLKRLFADDKSINAHIDEIMTLTIDNGFDGIDIDYEGIRSDIDLWNRFVVFIEALQNRAVEEGLGLRVILEPNIPSDRVTFPAGPEYVMMCYNLYGYDKKAGPKADDKFIKNMAKKMSPLPGKKSFALATGGYDWLDGAKGVQITEATARETAASKKASVYRSPASGALTYQYRDDDGKKHTTWYADTQTLLHWQSLLKDIDKSYGFMLWRIETGA